MHGVRAQGLGVLVHEQHVSPGRAPGIFVVNVELFV